MEALRHPWLEDVELRLAYGQHLAARGDSLGEWIAASTRLAEPEGLSLEEEWDLRQRAWSLLDAHGAAWTGGRRTNHCEFERKHGHPWQLAAGRLTPLPWTRTPRDLEFDSLGELESRGFPPLKIEEVGFNEFFDLESLAELLGSHRWLRASKILDLSLHEELPPDDASEELEFIHSFRRSLHQLRYSQPSVDLGTLLSHLPDLRELRLNTHSSLPSWVDSLSPRLEALSLEPGGLECVASGRWPRLRRLQVGHYLSHEELEGPPITLRSESFPLLEELAVFGTAPPGLAEVAGRLRTLSLSPDLKTPLGGRPPPPVEGGLSAQFSGLEFPRLRSLTLYGYETSPALLGLLRRVSTLRRLELFKTGLDDQGARALARLVGIRSLEQGSLQLLGAKGLSAILEGPISNTLRELDIRGGGPRSSFTPSASNYPLAGAQVLHDHRGYGLTRLSLTYLTRRSARVLATSSALSNLCELRVGYLRDDAEAIFEALNSSSRFCLTKFEVDDPRANSIESQLRELWGWRYVRKLGDRDPVGLNF